MIVVAKCMHTVKFYMSESDSKFVLILYNVFSTLKSRKSHFFQVAWASLYIYTYTMIKAVNSGNWCHHLTSSAKISVS